MTPKFSIVIPANNEENYLPKTLESINNQNYKDYEVIVVANGCTDKTVEVVTNLINDFGFPNLRLLRLEAANVSRARNYGTRFFAKNQSKFYGRIFFGHSES